MAHVFKQGTYIGRGTGRLMGVGACRVRDAIHPPTHPFFAHQPPTQKTQRQVEANIARCPDPATAEQMIARIDEIRKTGNSVGGACERRRACWVDGRMGGAARAALVGCRLFAWS